VVADGTEKVVEVRRDKLFNLTILVNDQVVAGPMQDTRVYRQGRPRIGRSTGGGYFSGEISEVEVRRNW
jgi:hypothetical protein